jgi:hypothetical protein
MVGVAVASDAEAGCSLLLFLVIGIRPSAGGAMVRPARGVCAPFSLLCVWYGIEH